SFGIRTKAGGFVRGFDRAAQAGINYRPAKRTLTWGGAGACIPGDCYGVPLNSVRYDSPTFGGFSFSASWGDDDVWDVGLRYAGELGGFKLAATVVYAESSGDFSSAFGDSEYTQ